MAELTTLEEKLAEVLGLAQAAQGATEEVDDEEIVANAACVSDFDHTGVG